MSTLLGNIIPIDQTPSMDTNLKPENLIHINQSARTLLLRVLVAGHCVMRLWYKSVDIWWPLNGSMEPSLEASPEVLDGKNERLYDIHSDAREFCLHLEDGRLEDVISATLRQVDC